MREDIKALRPTNFEQSLEAAALIASSVPAVGGLLSGLVMQTTSSRRWSRLLAYVESIEDKLDGLGTLSDDQGEIIIEIVERVIKERSQEKTDCYRNILLNALGGDSFDYDETLEMVKLVERLTTNHLKVLQAVSKPAEAKDKLDTGAYVERTAGSVVGLPTSQLGLH